MEVELKDSVDENYDKGRLADECVNDEAPLLAESPVHKSADAHASSNGIENSLKNRFHENGSSESKLVSSGGKKLSRDLSSDGDDAPLLSKDAVKDHSSCESYESKAKYDPKNGVIERSDNIEQMEAKYAPYARKDTYGVMGMGPVSALEKATLMIAFITIVPVRLILLFIILLTYYVICRLCTLFRAPTHEEEQENFGHMSGLRQGIIVQSGRFLARTMLFVLGFYWIKETHRNEDLMRRLQLGLGDLDTDEVDEGASSTSQTAGAIVSNHVSYLDILYHMSASFPSFVAKKSVAKLPFVGLISKCMGCIYVKRESKSSDFKGVSGFVTERLQAASSEQQAPVMLLFPEGTTTNGDYLLPFKTGAFLSPTPVMPVILKYPYTRFSPSWDSISGTRHLFLLLCQVINCLEVVRLPVYHPSAEEKLDPKLYASNVRTLMAAEGGLTMSNIGLPEKRIYHAFLHELLSPGRDEAQGN